jgi:hypothetical protein
MNTLQSEWESYKKECLPKDLTESQITAQRSSFYCGAIGLFNCQRVIAAASDEAGMAMLQGLHDEVRDFMKGPKGL